jgi:hypothetical protein
MAPGIVYLRAVLRIGVVAGVAQFMLQRLEISEHAGEERRGEERNSDV